MLRTANGQAIPVQKQQPIRFTDAVMMMAGGLDLRQLHLRLVALVLGWQELAEAELVQQERDMTQGRLILRGAIIPHDASLIRVARAALVLHGLMPVVQPMDALQPHELLQELSFRERVAQQLNAVPIQAAELQIHALFQ